MRRDRLRPRCGGEQRPVEKYTRLGGLHDALPGHRCGVIGHATPSPFRRGGMVGGRDATEVLMTVRRSGPSAPAPVSGTRPSASRR